MFLPPEKEAESAVLLKGFKMNPLMLPRISLSNSLYEKNKLLNCLNPLTLLSFSFSSLVFFCFAASY
jgi:hypothetical protein